MDPFVLDPFVLLQLEDVVLFLSADAELAGPLRPGMFRGPEPVEAAEAKANAADDVDEELVAEVGPVGRLVSETLPAFSYLRRSSDARR